jgi:hypothetical protein
LASDDSDIENKTKLGAKNRSASDDAWNVVSWWCGKENRVGMVRGDVGFDGSVDGKMGFGLTIKKVCNAQYDH